MGRRSAQTLTPQKLPVPPQSGRGRAADKSEEDALSLDMSKMDLEPQYDDELSNPEQEEDKPAEEAPDGIDAHAYEIDSDDDDIDDAVRRLVKAEDGEKCDCIMGGIDVHAAMVNELQVTAQRFWMRSRARRNVLRRLAEECAKFGPLLRRKAVELRATAAQQRLELLKSGNIEAYCQVVTEAKESRLKEILDETERILKELPQIADSVVEVDQPLSLRGPGGSGRLMPHQVQGLQWLVNLVDNRMSGILADDMGLGKTVQTIALLAHLQERKNDHGPHLIVVPLSTLTHWDEEFQAWLPHFKVSIFRGSKKHLELTRHALSAGECQINAIIMNYDAAALNSDFLSHIPWSCVIVDEGQNMRNTRTRFSRAMREFPSRTRLLLTGTPLQNSLLELWSLLSFVSPDSFGSIDDFRHWFALPPLPSIKLANLEKGKGSEEDMMLAQEDEEVRKVLSQEEEVLILRRLHRVLRPFLMRRTKDLVLKELPSKQEILLWIPLSSWQRKLYHKSLEASVQQSGGQQGMGPATIVQMRQILNHPYHFLSDAIPAEGSAEDRLISGSGKFEFLHRVLPRLFGFGHRVLIFAQTTTSLDLIQTLMQRNSWGFERIDGRTTWLQRKKAVERFNKSEQIGVMLLTTRAGGLGLNLQAADTVILFDSDWNPQVDLQAMDRVYRIGQTKPVLVARLLTPTGLDRAILDRAAGKLTMEQKVISTGQFTSSAPVATDAARAQNILNQLISEERSRESANGEGCAATSLDEVNKLLARSPEECVAFQKADEELLGPAASNRRGQMESVVERLERAGRLYVPDLQAGSKRPHKRARRA